MEYLELSNGVELPKLGQGVFRMPDDETTSYAVSSGIEIGFRHIDTAAIYGNERSTGIGIKDSGIPRKDLFLTTKLWNEDIRNRRTREAFDRSLNLLQTDYVDLYLIHWPAEGFPEAWSEMEKLYEEGRVRAIGVSNFHLQHFEQLFKTSRIKPMINQLEAHPYFSNQKMISWCLEHGIHVCAWSALGGSKTSSVRDDATLREIGCRYGKSSAQVALRWSMQRSIAALVRSSRRENLEQDFDIFDFRLTDAEMSSIDALNRNLRVGSDPDNFNF